MRRSINTVARRHRSLRSVFRRINGEVVQIVVPPKTVELEVIDCHEGTSPAERESKLKELVKQRASTPFVLTQDMLLRVTLLRFSPQEHALLLVTHHLVCDDWSTGIIADDLFRCYTAFRAGMDPALPEQSLQYGDFVRWQQQHNLESRVTALKAKVFSDQPSCYLQTSFPRPASRTYNGRTLRLTLPKEQHLQLAAFSRQHSVTTFMTLIGAMQVLLHCYSGNPDIGVVTCAANRSLSWVEPLVGRFANDLMVSTNFSGSPTLAEALVRTRNAALDGYAYQDIPFGKILEQLESESGAGRTPLFQVMFILQNAPKKPLEATGLEIERLVLNTGIAKHELTVWIDIGDEVNLAFEYNSDLFSEELIAQMIKDYEALLTIIRTQSEIKIDDVTQLLHHPKETRTNERRAEPVIGTSFSSTPPDPLVELQRLWCEILGVEKIGIDEDFFAIGGDSLRATRLLRRMEDRFAIRMSPQSLMSARTIAQQAAAITQSRMEADCSSAQSQDARTPAAAREPSRVEEDAGEQKNASVVIYFRHKSIFRRSLNRVLHLLTRVLPGATSVRPYLHRLRGVKIEGHVAIGDDVYIENEYPESIELHDGVMIGLRSVLLAHTRGPGRIVIHRNAVIGAGCMVVTSGNRTLTIGEGAVLMASSVITSDVPPFTLVGVERAKPIARLTRPFTQDTTYESFISSLRPLSSPSKNTRAAGS
jgi:acetyltransferase-like isoleucine patch superfamily enzyme/acyl carrier protein